MLKIRGVKNVLRGEHFVLGVNQYLEGLHPPPCTLRKSVYDLCY